MSNSQTMSLDQRIAALQQTNGELVASNNTLTQTVTGKMSAINATVASAEARMDQAIANLAASHSDMRINYYDGVAHSKASLEIEADPDQPHMSKWKLVPVTGVGYHQYPVIGALTKAHLKHGYSYEPGYSESPTQYASDWSHSVMQFVLTNENASSEQINAELERLGTTVYTAGGWNDNAKMLTIPCLKIADLHPYTRLFVRFVNRTSTRVSGDKQPQNIVEFGGNATFVVDRVVNYPHIKA
ncbi:hypothetical protein PRUB_a3487 [Pseudoalteromonas rubra]|uniref:Uncharacterized protein n=1 Tax=Pseudoalteromonas rubra TaxID=43658 RepID=A0A8T0C4Y5_9GAMM|nr:hypothetical protein [Pseudoalteromonas rubra]KAF7783657.1 hypothetical protein PRUB_a3487 [Pseudoalteromonas rubra]